MALRFFVFRFSSFAFVVQLVAGLTVAGLLSFLHFQLSFFIPFHRINHNPFIP